MSIPYFRIPRSLTNHPSVIDAPIAQRWVLIMLIEGAAFLPCDFCDHGKMMKIEPGQIVITQRGFAKHIKVKPNDVRRAIERFEHVGILTHKVTHTKSVITITHRETYELIRQYSDATFDAKVTQERRKSDAEKDKEEIEEKKRRTLKAEKIFIREFVSLTQNEIEKIFNEFGERMANEMLDILDSYKTAHQKTYMSDYGVLKKNGWVHRRVLEGNPAKTPYNAKSVDRRTCDINGQPVESQHAGRF